MTQQNQLKPNGITDISFLSCFFENQQKSPVFIDWITIKQTHAMGNLPIINSGRFFSVNVPGHTDLNKVSNDDIDFVIDKRFMHEGSYSTAISMRCDGSTVELSGNVGRFNRPDNLFGFTFEEIVKRCNDILNAYNLPPFTTGKFFASQRSGKFEWSGALVTRLDVTCNYAAFSQENARKVMLWLGSQRIGRMQNKVMPDGNSVIIGRTHGKSSKYLNHSFYNKYEEFIAHVKKNKNTPQIILDYCFQMGVVRSEVKFFSRFLTQKRLRFLGEISHERLVHEYKQREAEVIKKRMRMEKSNLENIEFPYRGTALAWKDGHSLSTMSKRTFYRHRAYLLQYGIDISVPCRDKSKITTIEVVQIAPVSAPDWYYNFHSKVA